MAQNQASRARGSKRGKRPAHGRVANQREAPARLLAPKKVFKHLTLEEMARLKAEAERRAERTRQAKPRVKNVKIDFDYLPPVDAKLKNTTQARGSTPKGTAGMLRSLRAEAVLRKARARGLGAKGIARKGKPQL
jgi:hypothetical protein